MTAAITLHLIAILHSSLQKNQQSHKRITALNTTPSKYHCLATIRLHSSSMEFRKLISTYDTAES